MTRSRLTARRFAPAGRCPGAQVSWDSLARRQARRGDRSSPRGDQARTRGRRSPDHLRLRTLGRPASWTKQYRAIVRRLGSNPAVQGLLVPGVARYQDRESTTRQSRRSASRSGSGRELPTPTSRLGVQGQKGKVDEAISSYREAIRLNPRDAQAQIYLGTGALAAWKTRRRGRRHREAVRLDSKNADAQFALGHALEQTGKMDEGIAAYRETIRLRPDHAEGDFILGSSLSTGKARRRNHRVP